VLEPVRSVYEYPLGALLHMPEINDEVERAPGLLCQLSGGEISFRLREPSGVYTSELSDSMSSLRALRTQKISHRTHLLVYEIKEASWWLERHGRGIRFILCGFRLIKVCWSTSERTV
jgi:hypothetical protein